jgi:hypothetical protein
MEEMEERVVVDAVVSKIDATCIFFTHKSSYTKRGEPYLNAVDVAQTISSGGNTSRRIIDRVKLTGCHGTQCSLSPHRKVFECNITAMSFGMQISLNDAL